MFGLIKDGMLDQFSLNKLTFPPIDHYQEVLICSVQLRNLGLLNIKNKDQKYFLCFFNPSKEHQETIKKFDKRIAEKVDYDDGIEFPVQEKDFSKIEVKNNICINVFGYEDRMVSLIYISDQKFEDSMDLLL